VSTPPFTHFRVESIVIQEEVAPRESETSGITGLPVWKRALLILAAASVSLGFALRQFESDGDSDHQASTGELSAPSRPTGQPAGISAPADLPAGGLDQPVASSTLDPAAMSALSEVAGPSAFGPTPSLGEAPAPVSSGPGVVVQPPADSHANTSGQPDTQPATPWSPLFLKGGLSIFVGLCVGHALRAFMKLSMIALGVAFIVMLGLQYSGLLEIDWEAASGFYDQLSTRVAGELASLRSFIAGSLPSAGLGSVGLIAGFKRGH